MGDFIVIAILAVIVGLVIRKMIKDKRAGKSSCGCDCGCCSMAGSCHTKLPTAEELKKDKADE